MSEQQMTSEEAKNFLMSELKCGWSPDYVAAFKAAISALVATSTLRGEQPCEKCERSLEVALQRRRELERECAEWAARYKELEAACIRDELARPPVYGPSKEEWEKAFDAIHKEFAKVSKADIPIASCYPAVQMGLADPRRKQAESPPPGEVLDANEPKPPQSQYRYPYSAEIHIDGTGESSATFDQEALEGFQHVRAGWYDVRWQEAIMNKETDRCGILFYIANSTKPTPMRDDGEWW